MGSHGGHLLVDAHVRHQEVELVHVLPVRDVVRVADGDDAAHDALHDRPCGREARSVGLWVSSGLASSEQAERVFREVEGSRACHAQMTDPASSASRNRMFSACSADQTHGVSITQGVSITHTHSVHRIPTASV